MKWLIEILVNGFKQLGKWAGLGFAALQQIADWMLILIAPIITIPLLFMTYLANKMNDLLTAWQSVNTATGSIGAEQSLAPTGSVLDALECLNYISPVEEGLGLLLVLAALWGAGLLYRFIKSLIPTLS